MVFIQKIIYLNKGWEYVINLDEYESVGTHWIALFGNASNIIYFDSFRIERIPKEIKNLIQMMSFL